MHPILRVIAVLCIASVVSVVVVSADRGLSLTVNSTHDAVDANPGDGICATVTGACTLRAAIMESNSSAGYDTVQVPAGVYVLTIPGGGTPDDTCATDDLDLLGDLTITGAGTDLTVVDGNGTHRVLDVVYPALAQIVGLTLQHGAEDVGGGIRVSGYLVLDHCVVAGNVATEGGGIFVDFPGVNMGTVEIFDSAITDNTASNGGGIFNDGGTVEMLNSRVNGNASDYGGGIYNDDGSVLLRFSTVCDNESLDWGGGIYTQRFFSFEPPLTVENSTICDNRARSEFAGDGGGIYALGGLSLTNSTISGNSTSGLGGGIYLYGPGEISSCTISGNDATEGGGLVWADHNQGPFSITGTIVARNSALLGPDCRLLSDASAGSNLLGDVTDCAALLQPSDLTGNPGIGPFMGDGTPGGGHHPVLVGSQVLDASSSCSTTDQLGQEREATCEIGAIEFFCADADGDTHQNCEDDCDDFDSAEYPGAPQLCDGRNTDCDDPGWPAAPADETDDDGDGYVECEPWVGGSSAGAPVSGGGDCDDGNATIYPGAPEANDGMDNQCPGDQGFGVVDEISGASGFNTPNDKETYSWTAQPGATLYSVARSRLADFSSDCATWTTPNPMLVDSVLPTSADVFHYLTRPLAPNAGSWGQDSEGDERSSICP